MKTNVTLRLFESTKSNTKAFIELKLDNVLIVKGLSLVEGEKGLFLSYPSKKVKMESTITQFIALTKIGEKSWRMYALKNTRS